MLGYKAGVAFLGAAFSISAVGAMPVEALARVKKPVCMSTQQIQKPVTVLQKYVSDLFRQANVTVEAQGPEGKTFRFCLKKEKSKSSTIMVGYYDVGKDIFYLNTDRSLADEDKVPTIAHEMRHRAQALAGIDIIAQNRNATEWDRVVLDLAAEADARIEDIVFVDTMRRAGQPQYAVSMARWGFNGPLLAAFDASMKKHPGDMMAAKRAVVYAFLKNDDLRDYYTSNSLTWIWGQKLNFDQKRPRDEIASDKVLHHLGQRGDGESYMDTALIETLRRNFTQDDYKRWRATGDVRHQAPEPGI